MTDPRTSARLKILVVDVGGSHVKCLVSGETTRRKFASGPGLTAPQMVDAVLAIAADWRFDVISIGSDQEEAERGVLEIMPKRLGA